MATSDQIKNTDIFDPNLYVEEIKKAETFNAVLKETLLLIQKTAAATQKDLNIVNPKSLEDVTKLNAAIAKAGQLQTAQQQIGKEKAANDAKLVDLERKKEAAVKRTAEAEAKKNQKLREQAGLIGSIKDNQARLNSLLKQAQTPAQIARINGMLEQQKKKLRELTNIGKQSTNTFGNALSSFQFKFNFLGNLFSSVTTGLIDNVFRFGASSVEAFIEAEKNARQLQFALKGNVIATRQLIDQSGELQDKGIFSDDDIQKAQTQLATYGATSSEIKNLIPLITDMAAATGKDLGEATDIVIKGINGQTRGLKMLGIDYKDTGNAAENLAILTDKLTKFQGANAAQLDTVEGKTRRLTNAWDDFKESVGEYLVNEGSRSLDYFDLFKAALTGNEQAALKFSLNQTADAQRKFADEQQRSFEKSVQGMSVNEKKTAAIKKEGELQRALNATNAQAVMINGKVNLSRIATFDALTKEMALLKDYQKTLSETSGLGDDPAEQERKAKDAAQRAKDRAAALEDLRKLEAQAQKDAMQRDLDLQQISHEKELQQIKEKHTEGLLSATEYERGLTALTEISNKERQVIRKKYADEEAKGYEELFAIIEETEAENNKKTADADKVESERQADELAAWIKAQEDANEIEKKLHEEKIARQTELIDKIGTQTDAFFEGLERRNTALENALSRQSSEIDRQLSVQQDRFNQGLSSTLAFQEAEKAKSLERQAALDKQAQKQEEAQQLANLFLDLFSEYVKEGDINAAGKALAQTFIAKGISNAIAGTALEGTEDTGSNAGAGVDGKGGAYWILHPNERVLTKDQNKKLSGMSNDDLVSNALAFQNIYSPQFAASMPAANAPVFTEMRLPKEFLTVMQDGFTEITTTIKNKPETQWNVDVNGAIVRDRLEAGKRTQTIYAKNRF